MKNVISVFFLSEKEMDSYQILREVGSGSYGRVYLAIDLRNNKQVAIKTISLNDSSNREVDDLNQLAYPNCHPYVVCYLNSFIANNSLNIVTDYIEGPDVINYVQPLRLVNQRQTLYECGRILLKSMLLALQYIHSKGIIHNDIKPGNIMVSKDRVPILIDFGIACRNFPVCKEMMGTSLYLPPEAILTETRYYASDLWSLAATVYEVITGTNIWSLNTYLHTPTQLMEEVIRRFQQGSLPNRLVTNDAVMDGIVNNFLQYDPFQRMSVNQALSLL